MELFYHYLDTELLDAKIKESKFPFSQFLFWDAAIETIDLHKHQRYIIERVFTRGHSSDVYMVQKNYRKEEIIVALKSSKELDSKTAHFCSYYYKIPLHEFNASSFYSR